jgi:DNA polymerase-3 subunit gamma/tau
VDPVVLERLALVARGGLRDALSLLDQLSAFAVGEIDMAVARAALSLPSIEAVRGVIDGITRRDASSVMAVLSDAAEGGADLRLFAEELVVHLRALMLLRAGADARLTDELPVDEVAWLRERAPAWSIGTLMQLVQSLSDALARTRDAAQFQVQTEVALLAACDVEAHVPPLQKVPAQATVVAPVATAPPPPVHAPPPAAPAPVGSPPTPVAAQANIAPQQGGAPPQPVAETSSAAPPPPPPASRDDSGLAAKWADVVDQVQSRNGLLASIVRSAHPLGIENSILIVAFSTEYNRKAAEKPTNRQLIETAFERVYGTAYRLRGTVANGDSEAPNLLDDPVINYAARTFGGQPKRLSSDQS